MSIFRLMTSRTIKQPLLGLELRVLKIANSLLLCEPLLDFLRLHAVCFRVVLRVFQSDLRQRGVIHLRDARDMSLMLGVASDA